MKQSMFSFKEHCDLDGWTYSIDKVAGNKLTSEVTTLFNEKELLQWIVIAARQSKSKFVFNNGKKVVVFNDGKLLYSATI